jgi:tetratricopeptide (TPR) repeat protein
MVDSHPRLYTHPHMNLPIIWRVVALHLVLILPIPASTAELLEGDPKEVIEFYQQHDPASANDSFTLGLAYFANAQLHEAIVQANQAIGKFGPDERREKALCYELMAQAYGGLGQYSLAAKAATDGQRLNSKSSDLATARMVYYEKAGDLLQAQIAKEHIMQLNPQFGTDPKMDPISITAMVVGVVALGTLITIAIEEDPETKRQLAPVVVKLAGAAAALSMLARQVGSRVSR